MNISRREYLKCCLASLALLPIKPLFASTQTSGNFRYIYGQADLRDSFHAFYRNVFHLYPEDEFHRLVMKLTKSYESDHDIYLALQNSLPEIKPWLASLRYALPALAKQKQEMKTQTLHLLGERRHFEAYMEIGTTGRYIDSLEESLQVDGPVYLLHTTPAGFGPEDIIERGQLGRIGQFLDMGRYDTSFIQQIGNRSLDLVTVYIGFHHCPLSKRDEFISAVSESLKPGGKLILRDHDAHNEDTWRVAALAHDTFNAGTGQSWISNRDEVRNFYSLDYIINYLQARGLRYDGEVLYQAGDPTRNGLMSFTRV